METNKQKKSGLEQLYFTSGKMDFKTKSVIKDKVGCCMLLEESIQQENITLVNIYAPNLGSPTYMKQILQTQRGKQAEIVNNNRNKTKQQNKIEQNKYNNIYCIII